jgi:hypothetical protein
MLGGGLDQRGHHDEDQNRGDLQDMPRSGRIGCFLWDIPVIKRGPAGARAKWLDAARALRFLGRKGACHDPTQPADLIDQGRGVTPADLVLKGGRVFDLITGDLVESDVAICGDTIVGVFGSYEGRQEIDVSGKVLVPGFIDTHLHIESSLVTPYEFDRCVTPRGVTTAICDPHEIANVCGLTGIRYFLRLPAQR